MQFEGKKKVTPFLYRINFYKKSPASFLGGNVRENRWRSCFQTQYSNGNDSGFNSSIYRWRPMEFDRNIELHQNVRKTFRHSFLNETIRPKTFIPNDSAFWEKHFKPIISGRVSLKFSQFQFEIKNNPDSGLSYVVLINQTVSQAHGCTNTYREHSAPELLVIPRIC